MLKVKIQQTIKVDKTSFSQGWPIIMVHSLFIFLKLSLQIKRDEEDGWWDQLVLRYSHVHIPLADQYHS